MLDGAWLRMVIYSDHRYELQNLLRLLRRSGRHLRDKRLFIDWGWCVRLRGAASVCVPEL